MARKTNRATLPAKRKIDTPKGRASDKDLAARVHRGVAYAPKPLPQNTR